MPLSIGFNMQEMQNEDTELGDSTPEAVPVVVLSNEWGKKTKSSSSLCCIGHQFNFNTTN